jgi:hypothetical protein
MPALGLTVFPNCVIRLIQINMARELQSPTEEDTADVLGRMYWTDRLLRRNETGRSVSFQVKIVCEPQGGARKEFFGNVKTTRGEKLTGATIAAELTKLEANHALVCPNPIHYLLQEVKSIIQ